MVPGDVSIDKLRRLEAAVGRHYWDVMQLLVGSHFRLCKLDANRSAVRGQQIFTLQQLHRLTSTMNIAEFNKSNWYVISGW